MNEPQEVNKLKDLSVFLDTKFKGPFGLTFGMDAIIGLIPVVGDLITSCLSFYIIFKAALMGCGPSTLIRMSLNVLFESLFDMIPVVGSLFDFVWKANTKNMTILQDHLRHPQKVILQSRLILGLIILMLLSAMVMTAWVSWMILVKILELF